MMRKSLGFSSTISISRQYPFTGFPKPLRPIPIRYHWVTVESKIVQDNQNKVNLNFLQKFHNKILKNSKNHEKWNKSSMRPNSIFKFSIYVLYYTSKLFQKRNEEKIIYILQKTLKLLKSIKFTTKNSDDDGKESKSRHCSPFVISSSTSSNLDDEEDDTSETNSSQRYIRSYFLSIIYFNLGLIHFRRKQNSLSLRYCTMSFDYRRVLITSQMMNNDIFSRFVWFQLGYMNLIGGNLDRCLTVFKKYKKFLIPKYQYSSIITTSGRGGRSRTISRGRSRRKVIVRIPSSTSSLYASNSPKVKSRRRRGSSRKRSKKGDDDGEDQCFLNIKIISVRNRDLLTFQPKNGTNACDPEERRRPFKILNLLVLYHLLLCQFKMYRLRESQMSIKHLTNFLAYHQSLSCPDHNIEKNERNNNNNNNVIESDFSTSTPTTFFDTIPKPWIVLIHKVIKFLSEKILTERKKRPVVNPKQANDTIDEILKSLVNEYGGGRRKFRKSRTETKRKQEHKNVNYKGLYTFSRQKKNGKIRIVKKQKQLQNNESFPNFTSEEEEEGEECSNDYDNNNCDNSVCLSDFSEVSDEVSSTQQPEQHEEESDTDIETEAEYSETETETEQSEEESEEDNVRAYQIIPSKSLKKILPNIYRRNSNYILIEQKNLRTSSSNNIISKKKKNKNNHFKFRSSSSTRQRRSRGGNSRKKLSFSGNRGKRNSLSSLGSSKWTNIRRRRSDSKVDYSSLPPIYPHQQQQKGKDVKNSMKIIGMGCSPKTDDDEKDDKIKLSTIFPKRKRMNRRLVMPMLKKNQRRRSYVNLNRMSTAVKKKKKKKKVLKIGRKGCGVINYRNVRRTFDIYDDYDTMNNNNNKRIRKVRNLKKSNTKGDEGSMKMKQKNKKKVVGNHKKARSTNTFRMYGSKIRIKKYGKRKKRRKKKNRVVKKRKK